MANYRAIADIEVEEGRIAVAQTAQAFKDNWISGFEGAPGAPRISPWAFLQVVEAGDVVRYHQPGESHAFQGNDELQAFPTTILARGVVRVSVSHRANSGADGGSARIEIIRVRGTTVASQGSWTRNDGQSFIVRTADVAVEPGDMICILHRRNSGSGISRAALFTLSTSGAWFWALGGGSLVLPAEPD